jgi:hypothetical protein
MMISDNEFPLQGNCTCGHLRYRVERPPLFVHCCHCSFCQRETGSAFVLNALIEASGIVRLSGQPPRVGAVSMSFGSRSGAPTLMSDLRSSF